VDADDAEDGIDADLLELSKEGVGDRDAVRHCGYRLCFNHRRTAALKSSGCSM
jgi:hypothetical protein